ncbi:hypothetical protein AOQ88_00865 [Candidatus Riesia sp. GBBU]|nr:hypothetical protein AOQ88_00865 [Candidatus Riesia sp. GBBU]
MKTRIILLNDIKGLGKKGEIIFVKPGYARNFLIPRNIAMIANRENITYFENFKSNLQKKFIEETKKNTINAEKIKSIGKIEIFAKSGKDGRLFGSIRKLDIINSLKKLKISVRKKEVLLDERSIRNTGEYIVKFNFKGNIKSSIKVLVSSKF